MSTGHWKLSKTMKLTNRGLETHISMSFLPATQTYRVSKVERMIGGTPSTTYDRILDESEAIESFKHLCCKAIDQEFTYPDRPTEKVFDLLDAEQS